VLLSEQKITRRQRHIAKLDKDCYYAQFIQRGRLNVLQAGKTLVSNAGAAAVFSATESYDLECVGEIRSFIWNCRGRSLQIASRMIAFPWRRPLAPAVG
jgi:hypothetical protein